MFCKRRITLNQYTYLFITHKLLPVCIEVTLHLSDLQSDFEDVSLLSSVCNGFKSHTSIVGRSAQKSLKIKRNLRKLSVTYLKLRVI